ncbi:hypothetical protein IFO70_26190 [Phormidium tenue FACHB-886]|nr:hypothetical protein [Phormidium tenue FACHB-886]
MLLVQLFKNATRHTIEQGWEMGKIAKQLIAQKWEENWDKPVSQCQEELDIQIAN